MRPSFEREALHVRARRRALGGQRLERRDVDLDVEVTRVREDRAVLHDLEVLAADHVLVARRRAEDVALGRGLGHRHDVEAVHRGLERAQRVDLGDDHASAHAAGAAREAAAAPAVAADDEDAAGQQHVRRADDAVERRLAGAVAVVEEMLRLRVVDGDHREREPALGLERTQPDDAGRRLLGGRHHVGQGIVARRVHERRSRRRRRRCRSSAWCRSPSRGACSSRRRPRRGWRTRRCRSATTIAAATSSCVESGFDAHSTTSAPAGLERAHQVRRLGRDVLARRDAQALERPLLLEARANCSQHWHLAIGPLDLATARVGQIERLDVVGDVAHGCHPEIPSVWWSRCSLASDPRRPLRPDAATSRPPAPA